VAAHHAGVAAATLQSARQTGAALGVAIFGALLTALASFDGALPVALWIIVAASLTAALGWRLSAGRSSDAGPGHGNPPLGRGRG